MMHGLITRLTPRMLGPTNVRRSAWLSMAALVLCSCRSVPRAESIPLPPSEAALRQRALPDPLASAVESSAAVPAEPIANMGMPIPIHTVTPWKPPGIAGPWPHDEYLADGGDLEIQANLGPDGEIRGLELEDTVVLYDTIDGRTCIEPSNRVCLYAPRFGAVRKVTSVVQNEQREQLVAVALPLKANAYQEDRLATTAVQPIQPEGEIGTRQSSIERANEGVLPAISRQPIAALQDGFAIHENFKAIRLGIFAEAEKARLLQAIDAAITWSHDKAVQVVLEGQQAVATSGEQNAQVTFRIDTPNHPCLRVIKVASTKIAKPGDIVDFTIRFDNLGDTPINHVVLVDNLTTRLEYMPNTAQSSRKAEFTTEQNEGDSLLLRWDFSEPLPIGQGGLVRFHCRVR